VPEIGVVLQNVQEREKWRRRVTLLETALREVRDRRQRLERRLGRLKREIARLTVVTRAARTTAAPTSVREVIDGRRAPPFNR
jgi:phage shock protein A